MSLRIVTGVVFPKGFSFPGKSPLFISASKPDKALKLVEIIPTFIPVPST